MSFSSCFRKASSSKSGGATPAEVSGADTGAGAGWAALGLEKSSRTSGIVFVSMANCEGEGEGYGDTVKFVKVRVLVRVIDIVITGVLLISLFRRGVCGRSGRFG